MSCLNVSVNDYSEVELIVAYVEWFVHSVHIFVDLLFGAFEGICDEVVWLQVADFVVHMVLCDLKQVKWMLLGDFGQRVLDLFNAAENASTVDLQS